jgi:predicted PurR-regulated permease PerM
MTSLSGSSVLSDRDAYPDQCVQKGRAVPLEQPSYDSAYIRRTLEVSIHIGLAIVLVAVCLLILHPFVPLVVWGTIIAIASYPTFQKLRSAVGGRGGLAAVLWTLLLLAALIIPIVLLTQSVVAGIRPLAARLLDGTLTIPAPPPRIATWPIVGARLAHSWNMTSTNLAGTLVRFTPQIKLLLSRILAACSGVGIAMLQFLLSILVSGALLANAGPAAKVTHSLAKRLFGEQGPEFQHLIGATIRSVTVGILGVALIQSAFAAVGFLVVGLPGAGMWAAIFLLAAVLQVGGLVLLPAVIYVFIMASTTKAVMFLVWCIIVGTLDNVIKPLLLGRGVAVPIAVIFLGALGGFVAMGIIGLFVGPIVLSIGYKLFLAWLAGTAVVNQST